MKNRIKLPVRFPFSASRMRSRNFGCNGAAGTIGDEPEGAAYDPALGQPNFPNVDILDPESGQTVNVATAATASDTNPLDPAWNMAPEQLGMLASNLGMAPEALYEDWQTYSDLDWTVYLANAVAAMGSNPVPIYERRTADGGTGNGAGIGLGVIAVAAVLAYLFLGRRK